MAVDSRHHSYADELFGKLEAGVLTPRWREDRLTRDLAKWIAMHDNDRDVLKPLRGWDADRPYKVDPLPSRISGAFADFLYGEDPTVTAADEADQELYDALVEENDYFQLLWEYIDMASAEGETYWRIYSDDSQSDYPIIDIHSRSMTVPLFRGRHVVAAAFVSVVNPDDENGTWRYVEVHEEGAVHNRLYYAPTPNGDNDTLADRMGIGTVQPLEKSVETENLLDVWAHGLPMLCGRIPNKLGRDKRMGISDYKGIEDLLLDLNEAHTIDAENYRLAGKKRAVMPERYARRDSAGNAVMDAGEEVLFTKEGWSEMEDGSDEVFKILEYTYDGSSSIARKDDLTTTSLTRVGLTKQFVDSNSNEGTAGESGTALKTRLIPTTLAARGKSRRSDGVAPYVLHLAGLVDALPLNNGGFDRKYAAGGDLPTVQRGTILPEDEVEKYNRVGAAVAQGVMSLESALIELHPRWDEGQIAEEAKLIRDGLAPPELEGDDEVT